MLLGEVNSAWNRRENILGDADERAQPVATQPYLEIFGWTVRFLAPSRDHVPPTLKNRS